MSTRGHLSYFRFCLCLLVVAMLSGCANRKIVTSVEDQSYLPGPAPQAQAPVAEAEVPPPAPVEAAKAEPTPVQAEPVQPTPAQAEKPIPPAVVEEKLVAEKPIVPAPPSQPPVPPARLIPDLSDIFFDFDRFVIRDEARSELEANASLLKSQSGEKILIEGHCDERGTSAYNLVLGERRAQAAAQYLRDLGVPSSRMQTTSYGKERPFCAEHSEACWQSNRRAHFTR
jgi:peptidoglycan-associated lipoprotein